MFAAGFHETIGTRFGNFVGSDRDGGPEGMLVSGRWLGLALARRPEGGRRRRHRAALGPLLPSAGRAGAARRLPGHARRDFDEEDVALSAFHSFCDRVGRGQFPGSTDRNDLWRLLATITARKAIAYDPAPDPAEAGRRPGARRVGRHGPGADDEGMARFLSREPTPEDAAAVRRGLRAPARRLGNPTLQDDRPAQAGGPHLRGDRRRAGHLGPDRRPQAPADPRDLAGGVRRMSFRGRAGCRRPAAGDLMQIDAACDRFEAAWRAGERPDLPPSWPSPRAGPSPAAPRPADPRAGVPPRAGARRRTPPLPRPVPRAPRGHRRRLRRASASPASTLRSPRASGRPPAASPGGPPQAVRAGHGLPRADLDPPTLEALRAAGYEILGELGRGGWGWSTWPARWP